MKNLQSVTDDDAGRRMIRQHHAVGFFLHIRPPLPRRFTKSCAVMDDSRAQTEAANTDVAAVCSSLGQEDSVLPIHDLEHVLESTHALGRTEEEKPVWLEGIVEHGNSFLLQLWPQVDQYITAEN